MTGSATSWCPEDLDALRRELRPSIVAAPAEREAAERDFGQLVRRSALAVLTPQSSFEVERIVAFANQRGLSLTARGRGMSQGGQTVPHGGVALDLSRMIDTETIDTASHTLRCSAGTTWRDAIALAAPHGLMPKVVPLNLDLTVGGLLSVAGVGATSHRHGLAAACVRELDVITGAGQHVSCSESHNRQVFDGSLGGLGRAALIVDARIELRPYAPNVRSFYLLFDQLDHWLSAQRALIAAGRVDYLEGFCTPCVQGLRQGPRGRLPFAQWFYALHASVEFVERAPTSRDVLQEVLPDYRLVHQEDSQTVDYAARYDSRFSMMRRAGAWTQAHPWVEAMLPGSKLNEILPAILDTYPLAFGDGPRLLFIDRKRTPPFIAMPDDDEVACCALLPTAVPPHLLDDTLAAFRSIHDLIVRSGGKRVLSGWTTMMDERALRDHYGEREQPWSTTRRTLDPRGVLASPFTEASVKHD